MKKTKLSFFVLITLLSFSIVYRLSSNVSYAQSVGLSIDPPVFEAVIKPGKTITQIFTIQNLSEVQRTLVARIVPFIPDADSGLPLLKPNLQPDWLNYFSLANSFIKLNVPFEIAAGQSQQLILTIAIPDSAPLTDHYGTLIISTNVDTNSSQKDHPSSLIYTTIGANLLLTTSNTVNPPTLVRIKDFVPDEKDILFRYGDYYIADNLNPIHFTASAENLGKFLTKTSGIVRVSRGDTPISLQSLIPLNLLSNSTRPLQGSPSGEIVFQTQFTDLGSHKVEIDLRSENSTSHAEITLILIPFKILLGLCLGLLLLGTVVRITTFTHKRGQSNA